VRWKRFIQISENGKPRLRKLGEGKERKETYVKRWKSVGRKLER
jgi:hypothetical protein